MPDSDRPAPTGGEGSPHDEIEITPEMIEAGIDAYYKGEPKFESEDDIVRRVYVAMRSLEVRWP